MTDTGCGECPNHIRTDRDSMDGSGYTSVYVYIYIFTVEKGICKGFASQLGRRARLQLRLPWPCLLLLTQLLLWFLLGGRVTEVMLLIKP